MLRVTVHLMLHCNPKYYCVFNAQLVIENNQQLVCLYFSTLSAFIKTLMNVEGGMEDNLEKTEYIFGEF